MLACAHRHCHTRGYTYNACDTQHQHRRPQQVGANADSVVELVPCMYMVHLCMPNKTCTSTNKTAKTVHTLHHTPSSCIQSSTTQHNTTQSYTTHHVPPRLSPPAASWHCCCCHAVPVPWPQQHPQSRAVATLVSLLQLLLPCP